MEEPGAGNSGFAAANAGTGETVNAADAAPARIQFFTVENL